MAEKKAEVVPKAEEEEDEEDDENFEEEEEDVWPELRKSFPEFLAVRLDAVKSLDDKFDQIEDEFMAARIELEKRFNDRKKAVFDERKAVITGATVVPGSDADEAGKAMTGIPRFWMTCILNHPQFEEIVTEKDQDALKHITDIAIEYSDLMDSFSINFHFAENDYFSNAVLSKTYHMETHLLDDEPTVKDIEATEITWKSAEKNLCFETVSKKQKAKSGKNKGQVRTIKSTKPCQSFFHFFSKPTGLDQPDHDDEDDDDSEDKGNKKENGADQFKFDADTDMELAEQIRSAITVDAFGWFTGQARNSYYGDEDDEDYGDEDDEDGDDDDDDDSDEDDDEDEKPRAKPLKASAKEFKPKLGPDGKPAECKQN